MSVSPPVEWRTYIPPRSALLLGPEHYPVSKERGKERQNHPENPIDGWDLARKWKSRAKAIREAANLTIEVGSKQIATDHVIPLGTILGTGPPNPLGGRQSLDCPIGSKSCLVSKSAPNNNYNGVFPLRTPIVWEQASNTGYLYEIDPWSVIEAEVAEDDLLLETLKYPHAYSYDLLRSKFDDSPNSYWEFDASHERG